MAVFRVHKNKDYTVMSNNHLRDKGLSLKAKGIMSLMLSLPDNWDYSIQGLVTLGKDGKASVASAIAELENAGYIRRTLSFDNKGLFAGYEYDIYESPSTENRFTENPSTGNRSTENPPQINTNKPSTKKRSTKKPSTDKRKDFVPPTLEEVQAYCKERKNKVDPQKFFDYFTASDWVDSKGNPVLNWKQKVITWEGSPKKADKPKQADPNDYGSPMDFYK